MIEKTQIQFCKQALGMNKQCPIVACRNGLGRLPLKEITKRKYYQILDTFRKQITRSLCQAMFTNIKRYG